MEKSLEKPISPATADLEVEMVDTHLPDRPVLNAVSAPSGARPPEFEADLCHLLVL